MKRLAAAGALALLLAPVAARAEHCKPAVPATAGMQRTLAIRIPSGRTPERVSDALPCLGARHLGGAFVGRDGRLYVWDDDFANVKRVAFPDRARPRLDATPPYAARGESLRVVGGDADSLGRIVLVTASVPGGAACRVLAWSPGDPAWTRWELPWSVARAGGDGLPLEDGARVRTLADGGIVLVPAHRPAGASALRIGAAGRFAEPAAATVVDAPELLAPRTDAAGRRVVHAHAAALEVGGPDGRTVASMAAPAHLAWKRMTVEGDLIEPEGSVLSLHSTTRGLAIWRLTPEIAGTPALRTVAPADSLGHVKRPRGPKHKRASSSITG